MNLKALVSKIVCPKSINYRKETSVSRKIGSSFIPSLPVRHLLLFCSHKYITACFSSLHAFLLKF